MDRYLSLDAGPVFSLSSTAYFADAVGRADEGGSGRRAAVHVVRAGYAVAGPAGPVPGAPEGMILCRRSARSAVVHAVVVSR